MDFQEIAIERHILRPSLTGILLRMQRDNLIFRLKSVNDQRKLYVSLAPKGKLLFEQVQQEIKQCGNEIEDHFPLAKQELLMALLVEFITIADKSEKIVPFAYKE